MTLLDIFLSFLVLHTSSALLSEVLLTMETNFYCGV